MLGLKLETDPFWVKNCVEGNISEILTDHAWCEQKAASTAITLIVKYSDKEDLVQLMTELAREEMSHFQLVLDLIKKRGHKLGRERKDNYVGELMKCMRGGVSEEDHMIDRLLFSAMIEARSCERFRVLSENINDTELAEFYRGLMASEARHYTTFLKLAKKYCNPDKVDVRWKEWIEFESELIKKYGKSETIHG